MGVCWTWVDMGLNGGFGAKSAGSSKLLKCMCLIMSEMSLNSMLDM